MAAPKTNGCSHFCQLSTGPLLFPKRSKQQGPQNQYDAAAQTGGELSVGDEAHPVGSPQYGQVAGSIEPTPRKKAPPISLMEGIRSQPRQIRSG